MSTGGETAWVMCTWPTTLPLSWPSTTGPTQLISEKFRTGAPGIPTLPMVPSTGEPNMMLSSEVASRHAMLQRNNAPSPQVFLCAVAPSCRAAARRPPWHHDLARRRGARIWRPMDIEADATPAILAEGLTKLYPGG